MEAVTNGIRRGFLSPPALVSSRVLVSMIEDAQHLGQTIIKKFVTTAFVTLPRTSLIFKFLCHIIFSLCNCTKK
jgi:hypothetical protein